MIEKLRALLDDTPPYQPGIGLTVEQVGEVLNRLLQDLERLIDSEDAKQ